MSTSTCPKCGATGTGMATHCGQPTANKAATDRAAEAAIRRNETSRNGNR